MACVWAIFSGDTLSVVTENVRKLYCHIVFQNWLIELDGLVIALLRQVGVESWL